MGKKVKNVSNEGQVAEDQNEQPQKLPSIEQSSKIRKASKKAAKGTSGSSTEYSVFISGIPYSATEEDIVQTLGISLESCEIKLPRFQDSGRCLGYGHLATKDEELFKKVLAMDRVVMGERYLKIEQAKGTKGGDGVTPPLPNVPIGCKTLFVKNLPYESTEAKIKALFGTFGIVEDIRMARNWSNQRFKGFAYVQFKDSTCLKAAVKKMHGQPYEGRNLILDAVSTGAKRSYKKVPEQQGGDQ